MDSRSVAIPLLSEAGGALDYPAALALLTPASAGADCRRSGRRSRGGSGRLLGVFTMTDPAVHHPDPRVHDADLGVHDDLIFVFTME
jgi:hypothetical protein